MKKIIALLLALIFMLCLPAGCAGTHGDTAVTPPASPSPTSSAAPAPASPTPAVTPSPSPSVDEPDVSPAPSEEPPPSVSPSPSPATEDPADEPPSSVSPAPAPSPSPTPLPRIRPKPVTSSATTSGAEATITTLYSNLAAGMTWGDVWDRYVYDGSKSLGYTRDSFITEKEDFQNTYGITYKSISVTSSEETKPGVFLVNGLLKYDSGGEVITENGADYVVFRGGEYFISISGSLLEAAFTKCISTFPNIACLDAVVCEYADKTTVECTLHNISDIDYYIGAATGLPVSVWQDGASASVDCSPGRIAAGGYYALTVELHNYAGLPDKLTLEKIIRLLDSSTGNGDVYTMDILLYY